MTMQTKTIEEMEAELAAMPSLSDTVGARAQEEAYTKKRSLDVRIHAAHTFRRGEHLDGVIWEVIASKRSAVPLRLV
jgi:hypothetical protein